MPSSKKKSGKIKPKNKRKSFLNIKSKGFSMVFLLIVIAMSIFLAGAFESIRTPNPTLGILDPNNPFSNLTDMKTLQLRTLHFVTPTPSPTPAAAAKPALCQSGGANDEAKILVGYAPANGQSVGAGGQIKVWVNDEGAPIIAPGEQVNPTTGAITTPGDRAATAGDGYLWEPALYIAPQTAESGGTPHFPTAIKGDYNNVPSKGQGSNVAGMDPVPGNPNLGEQYTAEDIWDVNSLGLGPGTYTAEFVIHDGDDNRGVGCVTITIQ
jgi:hypothetical protein